MDEAYRSLFEHAKCGMAVLDLKGNLRAVNAVAAQLLGCRASELVGQPFIEFLPAHQVTSFLEKLALLPSLGQFKVEVPLRQAQTASVVLEAGLLQWRDEPAALMFLRETLAAEETARGLEVVLKSLSMLAGDLRSAFFLIRPDGRMDRLPDPSPGMVAAPESPVWAWRVLHRQEIREVLPRVWGGERVTLEPTWYQPGEGETREVSDTAKVLPARLLQLSFLPLQLPDEPIGRILVTVKDCTAKCRKEERERSADRDVALSLFASALFQELNAYLGVILAQASALRLSAAPGCLAPPAVGSILDAAQEAASVLRRCSETGGEGEWGVVDLNACVLDTAWMLSHELTGTVDVQMSLDAATPRFRGSSRLIRAMVLAFGRQAATHMPGGGRILLETHRIPGATPVAPARAGLTISDTGLGVSQNYSTQPGGSLFSGGGGGRVESMSLTFARAIVQRHRGQCDASSVPGQGAKWQFRFPGCDLRPHLGGPLLRVGKVPEGEKVERPHLEGFPAPEHDAPEEESHSLTAVESPSMERPVRILFADDEDNILQAGRETLRRAGYEAVVAADGQEAFEHFQWSPASYALVVMDAYMPRMGGLEAYLRMQAVRPDLPVLFVSGFVRGASRQALLNACPGRAQVLLKPFTDVDLLDAVRNLLESQGA